MLSLLSVLGNFILVDCICEELMDSKAVSGLIDLGQSTNMFCALIKTLRKSEVRF